MFFIIAERIEFGYLFFYFAVSWVSVSSILCMLPHNSIGILWCIHEKMPRYEINKEKSHKLVFDQARENTLTTLDYEQIHRFFRVTFQKALDILCVKCASIFQFHTQIYAGANNDATPNSIDLFSNFQNKSDNFFLFSLHFFAPYFLRTKIEH